MTSVKDTEGNLLTREDTKSQGSILRRVLPAFASGAFAGIAGLILSLVIGREFGPTGAGVFFAVTGLVVIISTLGRLGADTGLIWLLPQLRTNGRADEQGKALRGGLLPVTAVSALATAVVLILAEPIAQVLGDRDGALSAGDVQAAAPGILLLAVGGVALAGTRGYGALAPFMLVGNVGLPVLRLAGVMASALLGLGTTGALVGWGVAAFAAMVAGLVALIVLARRYSGRSTSDSQAPSEPGAVELLWRFSIPRSVAAAVEAALVWGDVLLVAVLLGTAEAGVYAVLSRFVTTGQLGVTAVRVSLAPRFSRFYAQGRKDRVAKLMKSAAPVMLTLTWPIYILIAVYAEEVLGMFGPGFEQGADALTILCAAMMLAVLWGPVQSAVLMSGRSLRQLGNKSAGLLAMVVVDIILIPQLGLVGAAIGWSVGLLLDTTLDALTLRRGDGVDSFSRGLWQSMALLASLSAIVVAAVWLTPLDGFPALLASAVMLVAGCCLLLMIPRTPMALRGDGAHDFNSPQR